MLKRGTFAVVVVAALCASAPSPRAADDEAAFTYPVLRVARMPAPPVIDGTIDPNEWKHAAAVTAFSAVAGVGPNTLVPEIQQVVWYIGYDDTHLYLAMHSPHKKGTYPVARVKDDDDMALLFEDHVEIQLSPFSREQTPRPGFGFYKIMINPKGALFDWHYFNGTVGTEELWSMGGERRCVVTEDAWDLELSVEIARLQKKKLDGSSLIMQLVRTDSCAGVYFAGWVPCAWMSWDRFPEVDFDPTVPVFQFRKLGEVMEGHLDAVVAVTGTRADPTEVAIEVTVADGDGKVLHRDKQAVTVKQGETQIVNFKKKDIPVPSGRDKRNTFDITATYRDAGKTVTLYHNRSPFMRLDDPFREQYLNPWLAGRPQSGEWEYRIAYLPSCDRAEVGVDLDFFGMPADVQAATAFTANIRKRGESAVIRGVRGNIADLKGAATVELPDLDEGDYEAVFRLLGEDGKKIISEKIAPFERKRFEWEDNALGISNEVIPPFSRLSVGTDKTGDQTVRSWGASYTLSAGGLPGQIRAATPTGNSGQPENLLAAPIRLEAVAGGAAIEPSSADVTVVSSAWHRVDIEGVQTLGSLTAQVRAFEDYDGWYQVSLTLTPKNTVSLDALDLVVDLVNIPVDTLYVQRMGDGRYGNFFGGIPTTPGVHFRSTDLLRYVRRGKDWKSFVPRTYVGNGDRGLWFFTWSDADWELADDQPMMQIERMDKGVVRMRVRLLAGPLELSSPRRIEFALQAAPVKPNDPRYRTKLDENMISHDTSGYRYYGDSVDGFSLPRAEDYEALRKFLLYGPIYENEAAQKRWKHYSRHGEKYWGGQIVMYGSTWMTGTGAPEFKTFGGEWLRKSNWDPHPDSHFKDNWNYGGTIQWNTPERLTPTGINWTHSFNDFFVYYHDRLINLAGFNGTWWDNSSIGTVYAYDPARKAMLNAFNTLIRRDLCRRLNVVAWKHMRQPVWVMNMHTDFPWNQVFWMVENDWYCSASDMTSLDQWTLDEFRSMCRTKSTMMVAKPWFNGFGSKDPELDHKVKRSVDAMCLSHDVPRFDADLKRKLIYVLGYDNTKDCLFTGYWRTAGTVQVPGEDVYASIYANARRGEAVIVFFNGKRKRDQYLAGTTFRARQVVGAPKEPSRVRVYDFETDEPVNTVFEDGHFRLVDPILVPWHEYRVLGISLN